MQELWFFYSVCHLMLIDIYMKFCEDSLNGFQVIEQTRVWQTDRRLGENNMSSNTKGGDIIKKKRIMNVLFGMFINMW